MTQETSTVKPEHKALILAQAVEEIDRAVAWAKEGRKDLAIVFTNMAKLLLLEGEGRGSETEFWLLTGRSHIALSMANAEEAEKLALKARTLAEELFIDRPLLKAYAAGNVGRATAALWALGKADSEEARKLLSEGIFALSTPSHRPPADTPEKLKALYKEAFLDFVFAIQTLPAWRRR